jgi:aarF domain-containing kinase
MEFVKGDKIDDLEALKAKYGSPRAATDQLIDIFAKMIFLHGHVHCDAHPGNILVRPHPKDKTKPQIVLLDHGCYGTTGEKFRLQFSEMWFALMTMDYRKVKEIAYDMGIGEYYRYLPLLFTYRTINTTKKLGSGPAPEEKEFLMGNDEINMDKLGMLMQKLPTDLIFIFKASHIVSVHNQRAGGTTRDRLYAYTGRSIESLSANYSVFYRWYLRASFWLKVFLFEHAFWLYDRLFGFMRVKFDPESKQLDSDL